LQHSLTLPLAFGTKFPITPVDSTGKYREGLLDSAPVDAFSHLAVIAQVSATLLGFVAVFIVLSNKNGRFSQSDRHFIQAMILSASYAFFLALMPGMLSYFFSGSMMWVPSLAAAATVGLCSAVFQAWEQYKMTPEEAAKIHWAWHVIAWGMAVIMLLLMIFGLFGVADPAAMYISTATVSVILALWSFIAVVFRKFF